MEKPGTGRTCLDTGCFDWLVNIRPGYVVFRVKNCCYIEPYLPCKFAQQLGYDQIYVGNLSSGLRTRGGLVDGARAWLWNVTGCTGVRFSLPVTERQLELTFLYCRWLLAANESVAMKPIAELTAEAAARIATQMVYEVEYQKRKGKELAGPSIDKEQEDDPLFSEEEGLDADVVSGKAKTADHDEEELDISLSEPFFAELLDLAVADQIRRLKTRKRWKALPTYPHKMFVEIPGVGSEGGKEVKGRHFTRTRSQTVARIDPLIEPCAESIPSRPADPNETRPCKCQKMTLRRRVTSSVPNAEPLGDIPVVGGGGHDQSETVYDPPPDFDLFQEPSLSHRVYEAILDEPDNIAVDMTVETNEDTG
ncbi:uncharacterized protein LOC109825678 [Asparagus officinalis]|uniref:uncharacterized protein LOC109825678 n=1 Tax=Asparagus officinalis TaxID=4686 RepID=UPI00098E46B4|nr:uncharacterized protein LOC109825678 [Asparagus officinalis]